MVTHNEIHRQFFFFLIFRTLSQLELRVYSKWSVSILINPGLLQPQLVPNLLTSERHDSFSTHLVKLNMMSTDSVSMCGVVIVTMHVIWARDNCSQFSLAPRLIMLGK